MPPCEVIQNITCIQFKIILFSPVVKLKNLIHFDSLFSFAEESLF